MSRVFSGVHGSSNNFMYSSLDSREFLESSLIDFSDSVSHSLSVSFNIRFFLAGLFPLFNFFFRFSVKNIFHALYMF